MPTTVRLAPPITIPSRLYHEAIDTGLVIALIPILMCILSIVLATVSPSFVNVIQAGL